MTDRELLFIAVILALVMVTLGWVSHLNGKIDRLEIRNDTLSGVVQDATEDECLVSKQHDMGVSND